MGPLAAEGEDGGGEEAEAVALEEAMARSLLTYLLLHGVVGGHACIIAGRGDRKDGRTCSGSICGAAWRGWCAFQGESWEKLKKYLLRGLVDFEVCTNE